MGMPRIHSKSGIALISLLLLFTGPVTWADDDDYRGHMMGDGYTGMMGGGPGYGRGYGMGMDGYHGMGMMGGYGHMGMGGMGYGGMGMMYGPMHMLNLSDAQRKKINAIQDSTRKKHWATMGKIMDEGAKLRDLYAADRLDSGKIMATYDRIFSLQKARIRDSLTARNQQYDLLTEAQRKELKEFRGHMGYGWGRGRR